MSQTLYIATRNSQLALWQANYIKEQISLNPNLSNFNPELLPMVSTGDIRLETMLARIGGKGLFTVELEQALLEGRAHIAVHSLKDVPMQFNPSFTYTYTERGSVEDVVIFPEHNNYQSLNELPPGSVVGTSSVRRQALLASLYPQLKVKVLRGNVNTRLAKLNDIEQGYSAIILAKAGLERLDFLKDLRHQVLEAKTWVPAPGQGIVAIQFPVGIEAGKTNAQLDTERALSSSESKVEDLIIDKAKNSKESREEKSAEASYQASQEISSLLAQMQGEVAEKRPSSFIANKDQLNNKVGQLCALVERGVAGSLGGSCSLPLGVHLSFYNGDKILDSKAISNYWQNKFLSSHAYEADYAQTVARKFNIDTLVLDVFVGDLKGSKTIRTSYTSTLEALALDPNFNFNEIINTNKVDLWVKEVVADLQAQGFAEIKTLLDEQLAAQE